MLFFLIFIVCNREGGYYFHHISFFGRLIHFCGCSICRAIILYHFCGEGIAATFSVILKILIWCGVCVGRYVSCPLHIDSLRHGYSRRTFVVSTNHIVPMRETNDENQFFGIIFINYERSFQIDYI